VVDGHNTEVGNGTSSLADGQTLEWEWLVLYDDGETMGADTGDLKEIKNESR
jgi:hypothetical protein